MGAPVRFDPYAVLENLRSGAATVATPATLSRSVATVATVAGGQARNSKPDRVPKDEKIVALAASPDHAPNSDIERAAIIEYGAGVPREWAEGYARLLAMPRPARVPPARWQVFLDDCGRFLDRWAVNAAGMGWEAHDLFGLSEARPATRLDLAGLLWLLDGRELVAFTSDTAAIRTPTGALQRYYRCQPQPGQRLAWELDKGSKP